MCTDIPCSLICTSSDYLLTLSTFHITIICLNKFFYKVSQVFCPFALWTISLLIYRGSLYNLNISPFLVVCVVNVFQSMASFKLLMVSFDEQDVLNLMKPLSVTYGYVISCHRTQELKTLYYLVTTL